jgi:hypothetical protein
MIISNLVELQPVDTYYKKSDIISLFQLGDRYQIVNSNDRIYLMENSDKTKFDKGLKKLGYKKDVFK